MIKTQNEREQDSRTQEIKDWLYQSHALIDDIATGYENTHPETYHLWWKRLEDLFAEGLQLHDTLNYWGHPENSDRIKFAAILHIIRFLAIQEQADLFENAGMML